MNLRDLQYFVVLAKTEHFGEAARQCFVSQPTLSMQIKKLEEELGVQLFERDNKRVMLTDSGRLLLGRAKAILSQVAEMKEMANAARDPFAGELHLGAIPTVAPYLLPLIMPGIQSHFPQLKIWLIEDKTHHLVQRLQEGTLDAAIMALPVPGDFEHHLLFEEPFYFACSPDYPLPTGRPVQLEQLAGQPIMLLEEGHCLREQAMSICQTVKAETTVDFTATSLETLRLMVQAGRGVTLMPALAVLGVAESELKILPFANANASRRMALFWRGSSAKRRCLAAMAEVIHDRMTAILPIERP
ncbi:LysR substrate-binding domain-containing protein [Legionella taurinensis]|uniref:LysR family transcriptional regulator n=1 Tax=Legionella taurinensis TaxID=70611 RepID=A0A3A5L7L8_9GAMM|nr:LysR substrate-binding domain-containing protein [Legionella taurinensis]MDX1836514.1 LysR substrate-binding domain-containing protein [Legionella taurinensis]RJT49294.1 LysR family transcriptional regulator [Legionella taurinensis]RJT69327.1 LysR family transcriptional regulator [Legionella taurinensis]STY26813.1 hydrogen peroxide-inducible genes activator [Legionella taurinensis]